MNTKEFLALLEIGFRIGLTGPERMVYLRQLERFGVADWQPYQDLAFDSFKKFPSIAEIKALVQGHKPDTKNLAVALLNEVAVAKRKFGWPSPEEAREYLGPIAWQVVRSAGGWGYVCGMADQDTQGYAQLRDKAIAVLDQVDGGDYEALQISDSEAKALIGELQRRSDQLRLG